jgi:nicotinamidase-related amidase
MAAFDKLDVNRTAVLLIEFQNEFVSEGGKLHAAVDPSMKHNNMLANTLDLVNTCRSKGIKVIHAPITFSSDYRELSNNSYGILNNVKNGNCFQAKEWGGAIVDSLTPLPSENVVAGKTGLCGFASTNLDFILRQNDIKNLAICGFLTNCCVESSMRTAYEKGYHVFTLTDCCAATSVEEHESAVKYTFPMFSKPTCYKDFLALI